MKKIKIGSVGLGRLGYEHAVNIASKIPQCQLAAICDVDAARVLAGCDVRRRSAFWRGRGRRRDEFDHAFGAASRWLGGVMDVQAADGSLIEQYDITAGELELTLPASARVVLSHEALDPHPFYLAMENRSVQSLLRYLPACA